MYQTPFYKINSFRQVATTPRPVKGKEQGRIYKFYIMKIEGKDGNRYNVTSQGQGNLNTVLGAIGTANAMGLGNGCNGGFFGGLFGGNNNNGNCYISEKEFQWAQAYNTKQSEVDMLKSDQRTDGKLLDLYREIDRRFTATGREIAEIASVQAVTNQKLVDNIAAIDNKIDCNVAAIYREIDCRTLPLEKKVPIDSVCPLPARQCPDVQLVEIVTSAVNAALASKK